MLTLALLLLLPQDSFNPSHDPERSTGDSWLTQPADQNPYPPPSLTRLGDQAIRFTFSPPWSGGTRNTVTITPGNKGEAVAALDMIRCEAMEKSRCKLVLLPTASFDLCIDGDCSYAGAVKRIHRLLFDPAHMGPRKIAWDEPVPCVHGPDYLTELREAGTIYNLSGSGLCARNHPNASIYKLVRQGARAHWPLMVGEPAQF